MATTNASAPDAGSETDTGHVDPTAPDPKRWRALAVIAIAQLMVVLDASIVNIALPRAQADLHISDVNRGWVITAYTLAFGGLLLLGGRISDFFGRKRVFIIGLLGFAFASALGGAAPSQAYLFAARGLQGAFAALLAPAALSLISVTFTQPRERARAFGVYGAIAGGGAALGLIIGGVLTEYTSWRWCLFVNVPIALFAAFAAVPLVRESAVDAVRRYDIPGTITATLGLVSLVYAFTKASDPAAGWGAGITLALFAASAAMLVAFIVIESRSDSPLLPMRILENRNRAGSYLTSLLVGLALFGMFLFLTFYFQAVLGYSPLKSGFAFLPFSVGIIVSAGMTSQLLPRFGARPLMTIGLVMASSGMLWLTQIGIDTAWVTHVLPAEILMSIGMGLVFVPLSSTALIGVDNRDAGVASALVNTTQQIGGSLGTAVLNTIYLNALTAFVLVNGNPHDPAALVHGYTTAFRWSAGVLAFAAVLAYSLIQVDKTQLSSHEEAIVV